ncbi:putative cysteine proteinase inhibitor 7 [Brachypodium distachyon]|uniref:Cystatin domain-containing protein n=1 Tax=Brachypodium distachyon TaxID=15368 RepID=I1H8A7_BRADI|nr:putative cysteine proteinase inhibitor 7 [Brachypodium distachyon]KQK22989.1 hypothetical protein BRADI_1g70520v3 [Brachypodium distachyon]|eukprot:XP_003558526.1 putative cysteine proteinase inhibitor 7 [Brachypodium distachyon]
MRTSLLLGLFLAAGAFFAVVTPAVALDGAWQPINNITDPYVQKLGAWEVAAHGKVANDGLKFSKVVSGKVQIVAGTNYRLGVDALRLDGKVALYKTVVFDQKLPTSETRKLVSFDPAN